MAVYTPIRHPDKAPPHRPQLKAEPEGALGGRLAWDQTHRMWVHPDRRARVYVCSEGVEHRSYWRTHWRQGREDWVACEHEVDIVSAVHTMKDLI